VRSGGRVELVHAVLTRWAATPWRATDPVVLEATGTTTAVINAVRAPGARVVGANPFQVRRIAEARVKTDKIDAAVLAPLYARGVLPAVWIPDDATQTLRRQVARRAQIVRQRVRLKNEVHSVLHPYLIPRCPAADLFGRKGRRWLAAPPLPLEERRGVEQRLRELDRLGEELKTIDRLLGEAVVSHPAVPHLLTITGVNTIVAIGLCAAIGDITRVRSPEKLVRSVGLNPTRPLARARNAGRGRLGGVEGARPAARLLPSNPCEARPASGRRRDGAHADHRRVAGPHEGRTRRASSAIAPRDQPARPGMTGRGARSTRRHERAGGRLPHPAPA
jgi:transposase